MRLRRAVFALALGLAVAFGAALATLLPQHFNAVADPVGSSILPPPAESGAAPASFHHVHLNVVDPDSTAAFYEHFFGASRIRFRDRTNALFTERSFILMNRVSDPPRDNFGTSLWHIGWAGVDGPHEFEWRERDGIAVQTPVTPLGAHHYMYFWGPDRELVEVYTGSRNHRFEHVHLLPTDIDATIAWFREHLGLEPNGRTRYFENSGMRLSTIRVGNVNLIMFEVPHAGEDAHPILPDEVGPDFDVTDGRAMDHIAFSYPEIESVARRMAAAGVEIVRPIAVDPETGITSFFVRGPDGLLVEVVREQPVPEGIWR
jgi:catechol 2,3-dioxygenase-like lactoylglutathione lyase family enzyme